MESNIMIKNHMQAYIFTGLAILVLAELSACGTDVIDVQQSATSQVEAGSIIENFIGDMGFGDFLNMDLSQSSELKNQGISKDQIDSVHLTEFKLKITDPASGQDFTFLDKLSFAVEAPDVARKNVAQAGPFADGAREVTMTLENLDLAPYATAEKMNILSNVTGHRPQHDTTIRADLTFRVDVNVLGY